MDKPPADSRFQTIVGHYRKRFLDTVGCKADFDGADAKALQRVLRQHHDLPASDICHWLDNAFDSTEQFPLKRGFRFTEFSRHCAKYVNGPLRKGGPASPSKPQPGLTQAELMRLASTLAQEKIEHV